MDFFAGAEKIAEKSGFELTKFFFLLTFAAAITAFISQSLIGGGQMLFMPMYLYQQATALSNYPFAAAISITFLITVILCVSLFNRLGRMSRGYVKT